MSFVKEIYLDTGELIEIDNSCLRFYDKYYKPYSLRGNIKNDIIFLEDWTAHGNYINFFVKKLKEVYSYRIILYYNIGFGGNNYIGLENIVKDNIRDFDLYSSINTKILIDTLEHYEFDINKFRTLNSSYPTMYKILTPYFREEIINDILENH